MAAPADELMAKIVCIWGPPCAGKSTAARADLVPGDVLVERDTIHAALTGFENHNHTDAGMTVVNAAIPAMLESARATTGRFVFVTGGSGIKQRQPFIDAGAEMRLVYADRATCHARAAEERPPAWASYIDRWFANYETDQGLTPGTLV